MVKSLTIAAALGAFALTGLTGQVQAQDQNCVKAPRIRCHAPYVAQLPKPQTEVPRSGGQAAEQISELRFQSVRSQRQD